MRELDAVEHVFGGLLRGCVRRFAASRASVISTATGRRGGCVSAPSLPVFIHLASVRSEAGYGIDNDERQVGYLQFTVYF